MTRAERSQTIAWAALVVATGASFLLAGNAGSRGVAIGATMALAIAKTLIVLRGFMASGRLPAVASWCMTIWSLACGMMIAILAMILH